MKSMTGYGSASRATEAFQMEVEVKSYNNKFLDIEHLLPFFLSSYEMEIDKRIGKAAARGHVSVTVRVKTLASDMELIVDKEAVKRYSEAFSTISSVSGKALKPQLSDFLQADGVLTSLKSSDTAQYREPLFEALDEALAQFSDSKAREGEATRKDLLQLGGKVKDGLKVIERHAGELEEMVKKNLRQRMDEMLQDQSYDENRILQEVAVMLTKATVNEEIKRLHAHLDAYDEYLTMEEPVGKRIDFLCQEMNREINTIGSKSQIAEMNLQVVRMKDGLENIREQARNIE